MNVQYTILALHCEKHSTGIGGAFQLFGILLPVQNLAQHCHRALVKAIDAKDSDIANAAAHGPRNLQREIDGHLCDKCTTVQVAYAALRTCR